MAPTAYITKRASQFLNGIHRFVDDLPDLAEEWDALDEVEQVTFSLEWDHMMADYLTQLAEYHSGGQLTKVQQKSYSKLLNRLKDNMSIIERLDWYRPPVSLTV